MAKDTQTGQVIDTIEEMESGVDLETVDNLTGGLEEGPREFLEFAVIANCCGWPSFYSLSLIQK